MEVPSLNVNGNKETVISAKNSVPNVQPKFCKSRKQLPDGGGYGTGGRKSSVARVWVRRGTGKFIVNNQMLDTYFTRDLYRELVLQPFVLTNTTGQYDVWCTVVGGGMTGQAGAVFHGVSRALDAISSDFHSVLRQSGALTRDSRKVERKKYGKRKARKLRQFSKR